MGDSSVHDLDLNLQQLLDEDSICVSGSRAAYGVQGYKKVNEAAYN